MKHNILILSLIIFPFSTYCMEDSDDSEYVLIGKKSAGQLELENQQLRAHHEKILELENQQARNQHEKTIEHHKQEIDQLNQKHAQELISYQAKIEQLHAQHQQDQKTISKHEKESKLRARNRWHNTFVHHRNLNRVCRGYHIEKWHAIAHQLIAHNQKEKNKKLKKEYILALDKLQSEHANLIKYWQSRAKLTIGSDDLVKDLQQKNKTLSAQFDDSQERAQEQVTIIRRLMESNDKLLTKTRFLTADIDKLSKINNRLLAENQKLLGGKKTQ